MDIRNSSQNVNSAELWPHQLCRGCFSSPCIPRDDDLQKMRFPLSNRATAKFPFARCMHYARTYCSDSTCWKQGGNSQFLSFNQVMGSFFFRETGGQGDILGCEQWNTCVGQDGLLLLCRRDVIALSLQHFALYQGPIYATGATEPYLQHAGTPLKAKIEFKVWESQLSDNKVILYTSLLLVDS